MIGHAPLGRLLLASAVLVPGVGWTADWSLAANVAERLSYNSNYTLEKESPGALFSSETSVDVRLSGETKQTRWELETGALGIVAAGPGADESLNRVDPEVIARLDFGGKRMTASSTVRFSRRSVIAGRSEFVRSDDDPSQIDDIAEVLTGFRDAVRWSTEANAGFVRQLDPRNSIDLRLGSSLQRFSDDGGALSPTTLYGVVFGWDHQANKRTGLGLDFTATRYTTGNDANLKSVSFEIEGSVGHRLSKRVAGGLSLGATFLRTAQDVTRAGRTFRDRDVLVGVLGGARLTYEADATAFDFNFLQTVEPSALSGLQSRTGAGLRIRHQINTWSSVGFLAEYSFRSQLSSVAETSGSDRHYFALDAGYSIDLTRNWNAELGYSFQLSSSGDTALANAVFIGISRDLTFLH